MSQDNHSRPIDLVISRLEGFNKQGRTALCPAHGDKQQSLSVKEGNDGRVLLKCFAGCETRQIVQAMGLQMKDLFLEDPNRKPKEKSQPLTVQSLANSKGIPLDYLQRWKVIEAKTGVVRIPYFFEDGSPAPRNRMRAMIDGQKKNYWEGKREDGPIVPYGLWLLSNAREKRILTICEGESDSWTFWLHDIPALGIPSATMTKTLQAEHLSGIETIYIVREPDAGGESFVPGMCTRLNQVGYTGEAYEVPMSKTAKDPNAVYVQCKQNGTDFKASWQQLIETAVRVDFSSQTPELEEGGKLTQSQVLVNIAAKADFFITPEGKVYATFPVGKHKETWGLKNKRFKAWLINQFNDMYKKAPGGQALNDALNLIEAKALYGAKTEKLFIRVGNKDGNVYIDLGNDEWEAIEVTANGWQITQDCPVRFKRSRGMEPLLLPARGGDIEEIRRFVNVSDEEWPAFAGYVIGAFHPTGPYPILVLQGTQGSAKTTHTRLVRTIIDPNASPLRTLPKTPQDLAIMALNSWVVSIDNLSGISNQMSDAFCRLATGGGFSTRELYENDEEVILEAIRPSILNGIDDIAVRPDLADRSVIINLPVIPEESRRTEAELYRDFEEARPRIFGAILDAVSAALRNLPTVDLHGLPRMADFAKWATAAETACGLEPGSFVESYYKNRDEAVHMTIQADTVSTAIESLMEYRGEWEGTPTELLDKLRELAPEGVTRTNVWPKAANTLTNRIKRAMPSLKKVGIEVEFIKSGVRKIRLFSNHTPIPSIVAPVVPFNPTKNEGGKVVYEL